MAPRLLACGLFGLLLLAAAPAQAGVDVEFGANVPIGDDANLFFHISSRCFDQDMRVVQEYGPRFSRPDDFAVALFISQRSGRPFDMIFQLRQGGLSWWDVGVRVGVPVDAWFVPVAVDPGPPYGRAYGYWKKHQADPRYKFRLKDSDVRNLVALHAVHDYYGVSPERAMALRAEGYDTRTLMVHEYRGRHGGEGDRRDWEQKNKQWEDEHAGKGHGKGKGEGKGHGHQH